MTEQEAPRTDDRIRAQVEFERSMLHEHAPCDSCWMLVELWDRREAASSAPPEPPRPDHIEGCNCVNCEPWLLDKKPEPVAAPEVVGADVSALPLDVDLLARAMEKIDAAVRRVAAAGGSPGFAGFDGYAQLIADEYARLSESGSPTPPGEERP